MERTLVDGKEKLKGMDLFAGIGGITQSLSPWVKTICYVEIEPYCQAVLMSRIRSKELDDAPIWGDIREFDPSPWAGKVDIVTAGFPCQDISQTGRRAGIQGEKSGLFFEIIRLIREIQPAYVFLENVAALRFKGRGLDAVLGHLAACGYDAKWDCVPACSVRAHHERDRIFILAYTNKMSRRMVEFEGRKGWIEDGHRWEPEPNVPSVVTRI